MSDNGEVARHPVTAPGYCPYCRATELTTASKVVNESTYWRCMKCGEIWNPGRLKSLSQPLRPVKRW